MFWLGLSKLTFSQTLPIFWVKVEVLCRCKQFITIASVICRTFEWRWRSHFQAANMSKLPRGLHCLSQNCPISCQLMESMSTCRLGIYFATSSTLKPFITKLQNVNFPYWLLYIWHWLWEFDDSTKFCEKGQDNPLMKRFSFSDTCQLHVCDKKITCSYIRSCHTSINAHAIVCFILLTTINIITLDFYILLFVGSQTWITYLKALHISHIQKSSFVWSFPSSVPSCFHEHPDTFQTAGQELFIIHLNSWKKFSISTVVACCVNIINSYLIS